MRKEDFLSIIVYLLMLIVALFIGLQIINPALNDLGLNSDLERYWFAISTIVVGVLINVVLFELGHVLGAIAGGYKVISVNILGLMLYRTKDKWRFGFRRYEGLTGETKIIAKKEHTKPRLYLFGPTLLTLLEFGVAIILFLALNEKQPLYHQSLIVAGIGTMLLLYNIMPFKLDNFTDGYYIILLGRKINVTAYNELIRIESKIFEGEDIGEVKAFDEVTTMTARVSLYRLYQMIDNKQYEGALSLIEQLIEGEKNVELEFIARIKAQKIYILLLTKALEVSENYWLNDLTLQERRFISNDLTYETMRAYLLYSGLVTESESECAFVLNRLKKAESYRFNDFRAAEELALIKEVYTKIIDKNPTWEIKLPE